jgi:hypothetical protein
MDPPPLENPPPRRTTNLSLRRTNLPVTLKTRDACHAMKQPFRGDLEVFISANSTDLHWPSYAYTQVCRRSVYFLFQLSLI